MSLGIHTKCDLSARIAKLDITVLIRQTEVHYYSLLRKIQKQSSEILNDSLTQENREKKVSEMSAYGSNDMIRLTNNLVETTELLHTLYNSKDRKIEFVNIPAKQK